MDDNKTVEKKTPDKKPMDMGMTAKSNALVGAPVRRPDPFDIDYIDLLLMFKKHILFIVAVSLLFANVFALRTMFLMEPTYESTCKIFILSRETRISSLADLQLGPQLAQDYFILTKSRPVLNKVNDNLGLGMSYEGLAARLTISNPTDSHILELRVVDTDPYRAQKIVNEIAYVSVEYISEKMEMAVPHIVEEGVIPYLSTSPNMSKNVKQGLLVGLVLALAVLTVLYLLNDTIATEEDVDRYLGLYTLAVVPDKEDINEKSRKKSSGKKRFDNMIKNVEKSFKNGTHQGRF